MILRPVAETEAFGRIRSTQIYIENAGILRLVADNDSCSDYLVNKYLYRYEGVVFDENNVLSDSEEYSFVFNVMLN